MEAFDCLQSHSQLVQTQELFEAIARDIEEKGFSINPAALPLDMTSALIEHLDYMSDKQFHRAGIGRDQAYMHNGFVRSDAICWITGNSQAGQQWLHWADELKKYLNRRLFLGLFSFESHFAHYQPGDFYRRHRDAFQGEANRVLSIVVYLNANWHPEDGGELELFLNDDEREGLKVTPGQGTVVAFLSEDFPHQVLPATRDRYSIAGWYRVNTSSTEKIDPPT